MKVTGAKGVAPASARRSPKRSSEAFALADSDVKEVRSASGPAPIASVDALIALQGQVAPDADSRRSAVVRAEDLLDILDDIRLGLLGGGVPSGRLSALVQAVGRQRASVADARLSQLLDEIDLRAQVELAKLRASGL